MQNQLVRILFFCGVFIFFVTPQSSMAKEIVTKCAALIKSSVKPKENQLVREAIIFAKAHHKGQFRKFDGLPYITHPIRVAEIVKKHSQDFELIIAAYLHDLLEDTAVTRIQIEQRFGKRVASIVSELTTNEDKLDELGSKTTYLTQKMMAMSFGALLIKLADRLDNVSDFENADPHFILQYRLETQRILSGVERRIDLPRAHRKLMRQIYEAMLSGV
ncbi:MAG: bifunctional (p)ppGpp synthetase/guanosine-3',5'-bis(diphosphate) 3'-pyrophosphohydrolase [Bdellovibrionales bacterium]|nr:bifunctional (p)ppGpp synthetase/guanosine-3',5'-bis(diphosphate) 3'-pyrophosphohydrolase [Bdellovibrionales bacterium]